MYVLLQLYPSIYSENLLFSFYNEYYVVPYSGINTQVLKNVNVFNWYFGFENFFVTSKTTFRNGLHKISGRNKVV